jgi:hypothetical protein
LVYDIVYDIGYYIVGFSFDIEGKPFDIVFRHEDAPKTPFLPFFDIDNYDIVGKTRISYPIFIPDTRTLQIQATFLATRYQTD